MQDLFHQKLMLSNTAILAPVDMVNICKYSIVYSVLYIPGGDRQISEPSTVSSEDATLLMALVKKVDPVRM